MKRLSTGMLVALMFACCGLSAVAAPSPAASGNNGNGVAQAGGAPPADFGSSALRTNSHSLQRPPRLHKARPSQARSRARCNRPNGTLLIPLRSMFEQMGATVSWDAGSKTATVSKPGAEVKVTVGKPEVVINGESRPLDVPPMVYQGVVARSGSRHFRRHGRLRAVGSGQASRRRAVYSRDAAADPGSAAADRTAAAAPAADAAPAQQRSRSSPATTSSHRRSTTSSVRATPATARSQSAAPVSSRSATSPSWLKETYERWQYPHNCNGIIPGNAAVRAVRAS